jgi:hypothetical protein
MAIPSTRSLALSVGYSRAFPDRHCDQQGLLDVTESRLVRVEQIRGDIRDGKARRGGED